MKATTRIERTRRFHEVRAKTADEARRIVEEKLARNGMRTGRAGPEYVRRYVERTLGRKVAEQLTFEVESVRDNLAPKAAPFAVSMTASVSMGWANCIEARARSWEALALDLKAKATRREFYSLRLG